MGRKPPQITNFLGCPLPPLSLLEFLGGLGDFVGSHGQNARGLEALVRLVLGEITGQLSCVYQLLGGVQERAETGHVGAAVRPSALLQSRFSVHNVVSSGNRGPLRL